jgi:hypothetical protein
LRRANERPEMTSRSGQGSPVETALVGPRGHCRMPFVFDKRFDSIVDIEDVD